MKSEIINGALTVYFPKEVLSSNANAVSDELFGYVDANPSLPVTIDMSETNYISSSGLRIILKLQKSGRETVVSNVSPEVYEIFDMTGFTSFVTVNKRRRSVSIDGARLIGEGYSSKVYSIADDTIVKVFIRDTSLEDINRELNLAKKAFILGIPTAISYDVVDVNGRYGVVFELINCGLLRDALLDDPDSFDDYMQKYADLLLALNTTDVGDTVLPDIKAIYLKNLPLLKGRVSEDDYAEINAFINSIPEAHTFVHGDCHIKNVMYSGSELLLIDMDTLSYGSPLFELAQLYAPYCIFPEIYDNNCMEFFGIPDEMAKKIMSSVFNYYFKDHDEAFKDEQIQLLIHLAKIYMMLFLAQYEPDDKISFAKAYSIYQRK